MFPWGFWGSPVQNLVEMFTGQITFTLEGLGLLWLNKQQSLTEVPDEVLEVALRQDPRNGA